MKEEFEFKLNKPITYQRGSESNAVCDTLILKEPSYSNRSIQLKIEQKFARALRSLQSMANNTVKQEAPKQSDQDTGMTSDEVISILMMSDIDFDSFTKDFGILMKSVCYIDGDLKLTKFCYDKISSDDLKRLIGEYVANFMIPSWLNGSQQ